uniref:Uncharacterized protein n=1 Tax=Rhizophora mucronata TaxID=61149 RepID=A0A2P2LCV2_RHIMU
MILELCPCKNVIHIHIFYDIVDYLLEDLCSYNSVTANLHPPPFYRLIQALMSGFYHLHLVERILQLTYLKLVEMIHH